MANITRPVTSFYHLCSAGNRTDLLFHNPQEFISGMNLVAIAVHESSVKMLAFCIMDNHFHFLISTTQEIHVTNFARHISQLYQRRITSGDHLTIPIRWSYFKVDSSDYMKSVLVYIIKNPMNSYYHSMPTTYPWSSSSLYFCNNVALQNQLHSYHSLKELGKTKVLHLIRSKHQLPDSWLMTPMGYVWPGSYIDYQEVENIFNRGVREYLYYLSVTKKEDLQDLNTKQRRISIPDQEIRKHALELCEENYHHNMLTNLKLSERQFLQKELQLRYGCAEKQIARILHLSINSD